MNIGSKKLLREVASTFCGAQEICLETPTFRILVVDDFEPWRRKIWSTLEEHSDLQIVGEAADGVEAVQQAQELKPDLILLDISLPRLNGIEVARHVDKMLPDTKIIFFTSNSDRDMVEAVLTNGAYGFVLKADGQRELLHAIRAALRGERFVSRGLKGLNPS